MELLVLTVTGPVASFRRPLDLNYQRTLPLPPPTTLIGIAGAALGLSDLDLWSPDSPLLELKVSVLAQPSPYTGGPPGRARDMWTVLKIKDNRIAERSPYFRELLFYTRYTLLYGGPRDLLENLAEAFMNPSYPLSLGRDDELLWIESPPKISPLSTQYLLKYKNIKQVHKIASKMINPRNFHGDGANQCQGHCSWMQNCVTDTYGRALIEGFFDSGIFKEIINLI